MMRSLIAVILATILGLTAAKFVEGAGQALLHIDAQTFESGDVAPPAFYQGLMSVGWFAGAFAAAAFALLLARRWAPIGVLAAATVLFSAVITQISFPLSWWLWPLSLLTTALGALAALKLLGARRNFPAKPQNKEPFRD